MSRRATLRRHLADAAPGLVALLERLRMTPTGGVVIVAIAIGWIAARAAGSRTMYLIAYAAAMSLLLAWSLGRRRLSIDVDRSGLPVRMRAGQHVMVELRVTARRRTNMVVLSEEVPEHLGTEVNIPIGMLGKGEELAQAYKITPRLRGVYQLGPLSAHWSDPWGLTTHSQVLAEPTELIVHPPIEPTQDRVLTRMWEDPPIRPPVSKPWPVGFEFYGMREYVPGDDLRRIVWATVAKTGRLMVRESEQGITDRVLIVLDTDRAAHSPGAVSETFETGVRAAASIAVQHLREGFVVTVLTNDGVLVDARHGNSAELPVLDEFAGVELGRAGLREVGPAMLEHARSRPHVVVISPRVGLEEARQLKLVVNRGVSVLHVALTWEGADSSSAERAASIGCQVVKLAAGASVGVALSSRLLAGGVR